MVREQPIFRHGRFRFVVPSIVGNFSDDFIPVLNDNNPPELFQIAVYLITLLE